MLGKRQIARHALSTALAETEAHIDALDESCTETFLHNIYQTADNGCTAAGITHLKWGIEALNKALRKRTLETEKCGCVWDTYSLVKQCDACAENDKRIEAFMETES